MHAAPFKIGNSLSLKLSSLGRLVTMPMPQKFPRYSLPRHEICDPFSIGRRTLLLVYK